MKVTNIDRTLTSQDEDFGERYFLVDGEIKEEWAHFFDEAYSQHFNMMKRAIRIRGQYVIVECPMDEMQAQIDLINRYCRLADAKLEQWHQQKHQEREEELKRAEDSKKRADQHFDNLKF